LGIVIRSPSGQTKEAVPGGYIPKLMRMSPGCDVFDERRIMTHVIGHADKDGLRNSKTQKELTVRQRGYICRPTEGYRSWPQRPAWPTYEAA
jgi:hypothetical protein